MKKKIVTILVRILIFKLAVTTTGFAHTKKLDGVVSSIKFHNGLRIQSSEYTFIWDPILYLPWGLNGITGICIYPAQKSPYMQEAFHFLKMPPKTLRNLKSGLN
jgi:hypothetical protein